MKKGSACEITQVKNLKKVKVKELGKVYPFLQTYSHLPWDTAELFALSVLSLPIKKQATFSIPDPRAEQMESPPSLFQWQSTNLSWPSMTNWVQFFSLDGFTYEEI